MTAMVSIFGASVHAVAHRVGMSEALHGMAAVAEGHHGRRRQEAKNSEGGKSDCHAEAKPPAELL